MSLWKVSDEFEKKSVFNWGKVDWLLCRQILLVHFGDFWMVNFCLVMWDILLFEEFEVFSMVEF